TRVDALGAHREASEDDAGHDGAVRLQVRLAEVDHAIGHAHREDRSRTERAPKRAEPEAAKEKLETKKLREVHPLPNQKVEVASRGILVKWVVGAEIRLTRDEPDRRQHEQKAHAVDPCML